MLVYVFIAIITFVCLILCCISWKKESDNIKKWNKMIHDIHDLKKRSCYVRKKMKKENEER